MFEEIAGYKVLIDALGGLLAPVIAATVAFIAYQQWRVNRKREVRESKQLKALGLPSSEVLLAGCG